MFAPRGNCTSYLGATEINHSIIHYYLRCPVKWCEAALRWSIVASQARLFRAVVEITARESHEEEELLPELLQREKSLVAFENVIVKWNPRSGFIA